ESGIYMGISLIMGIIIFMFITMFGSSVMSSVIEEKSSRVVEVLISSAKATELMYGKIIGVALVAFTQFLLWIVLTCVIVGVFSTVSGTQMFSKQDNAAQIMDMAGGAAAVDGMNMPDMAQMAAGAEEDGMAVVFSTLANIPWATLIISFFIFFILGYLLYASLYAAIGASVENVGDSQQLQMPITIPLMIAYMVVFVAFRNPDGPIVFWTSMIPFTSPIVMLARIPYGVPFWQLAVSVVLLILTFIFIAWVSAKIYKAGILIFGKKATFADLWKWLKQN
ncbi:MAG: ABC transporter permease, partial [Bacteroidales bacterium]|nr:ABC transporter permease [Bacteroidales bacterium]